MTTDFTEPPGDRGPPRGELMATVAEIEAQSAGRVSLLYRRLSELPGGDLVVASHDHASRNVIGHILEAANAAGITSISFASAPGALTRTNSPPAKPRHLIPARLPLPPR